MTLLHALVLVLAMAAPTATPYPTNTPAPTYTPFPTWTPAATATATPLPSATATPVPTATPYPQGYHPTQGQYCTGLLGWCPDLGGLISAGVAAMTGWLNNVFGNLFQSVTAPFARVLTTTPDPTESGTWTGISTFYGSVSQLSWALFASLLVIAAVAAYARSVGAVSADRVLAVPWRGVIAAGLVAGYSTLLHLGLTALNGLTGWIMGLPVAPSGTDAFSALGSVLTALGDLNSPAALLKLGVLLLGFLFALLAVFVRMAGLAWLYALVAIGPLCLITWPIEGVGVVAVWWLRSVAGLALWPVGYAVLLKVTALLLLPASPFASFGDIVTTIGAASLVWGLSRVPHVVSSLTAGASSSLASAASAPTETAVGVGMTVAKAKFGGGRMMGGGKP